MPRVPGMPLVVILALSLTVVPGGCRSGGSGGAGSLLAGILGDTSRAYREKIENALTNADADVRRQAVMALAQKPGRDWTNTAKVLALLARRDNDAQVRGAAVQVLAEVSQGELPQEVLTEAANDSSNLVRLECVYALAQCGDKWCLHILAERLANDTEPAIRSEAAAALSHYRDHKALWSLWRALDAEQFAVAFEARQSLIKLTGRDFGYDKPAWQGWLSRVPDPFAVLAGDYD